MSVSIGIDVGTTNVKVVAVGPDGDIVASHTAPLVTRLAGDIATQDPNDLWDVTCGALAATVAAIPAGVGPAGWLGVCSQYSSIVPVDASVQPVGDLKLYLDRRGTAECHELLATDPAAFADWTQRHGLPPVGGGLSLGHLLWFTHHRPDVHDRTAAYLEPMDYITARLTGRICATQGSMFASQLVDNRQLGVTAYDNDLMVRAGVDPHRLPPLVDGAAVVGTVAGPVAAAVGLGPDVRVRAAMNDSHAGAMATGAWKPSSAGLMVGTTAVLVDNLSAPASDLSRGLGALPGPVPHGWLVWAENGLAGRVVDHVVSQFVPSGTTGIPNGQPSDVGSVIEACAHTVPPGADGVLCLPWLAGSMAPVASAEVRGGFMNLSLHTGSAHLVRAAAEGVAHNARWLAEAVEDLTGRPMDPVVLGGGAARSPVWAAMFADIMGRHVAVLADPAFAAARAVALSARLGPAVCATDPDGLVVRTVAHHAPNSELRAMYDDAHARFRTAFGAAAELGSGLPPGSNPAPHGAD